MNSVPTDTAAFSAEHMTKVYPGHTALSDVTLEIPSGRVIISLFLAVTTIGLTHGRGLILSPAGISISVLVTAAGLVCLRRRIRQYYATCNLPDGATWVTPFGAPAAARQ